jgi:group I intron endonuclease
MWKHTESGKIYIGSAKDLRKRLRTYYNINDLERNSPSMAICRALLKYGYSRFSLTILEYCEVKQCLERENHYFKLFKPEYNILKKAGSSLGFVHSEESKALMRGAALGRKLSEETRAKMSASQKGIPRPGREGPKSEETKGKISDSLKGTSKSELHKAALSIAMIGNSNGRNHPNSQEIEVIDLETNESTIFPSMREAARALDIRQTAISKIFERNQNKPYRGRYIFRKK